MGACRRSPTGSQRRRGRTSISASRPFECGIRPRERDDSGFASDRRRWLDRRVTVVSDRILDFTATDARTRGELSARIGRLGADLIIAAQAHLRDVIVVTRDGADFEKFGVRLVDPF